MSELKGIKVCEEDLYGCQITTVEVKTKQAAKQLGRAVGSYITIQAPAALDEGIEIAEVGECLAVVLDRVLRPYYQGKLCICGLGNQNVPADSLGPEVANRLPLSLFAEPGTQGNFQAVCSLSPGTQMTNGIKTETIVGGIVQAVGADCLLLVDSSTANDPDRLFRTIQLSTAGGINPYWADRAGEWASLGIPVISICVPTVIPLSMLCPGQEQNTMVLTNIHVQQVITAASIVISYAILRTCWPSLSKEICFIYAKGNQDPIPYSSLWMPDENKDNSRDQE